MSAATKVLWTAMGYDLPLEIAVKFPTEEIQVLVRMPRIIKPPTQNEVLTTKEQIAFFRKDHVMSAGDYTVYDLVNRPPKGWMWIVQKGKLCAIRSLVNP